MAQPLSGFEPPAMSNLAIPASARQGTRVNPWDDNAIGDAQCLVDALEVNLHLLSASLNELEVSLGRTSRTPEQVELCQQLVALLKGAILVCSDATRPNSPLPTVTAVVEMVLACVVRLVQQNCPLVVGKIESDLWVAVERERLQAAIVELALVASRLGSTSAVELSCARCGSHAVLTVSLGVCGVETDPDLSESFRQLSTLLQAHGGYLDMERGANDVLVTYLVLPVTDPEIESDAPSGIGFAGDHDVDRGGGPALGQKRSETMMVNSDRFGAMEVDASDLISFPSGIIGFPSETEFVLVRKADSQMIGWLQSTHTTYLTLPVVSVHAFAPRYPDVALEDFADRSGLGSNIEELAVVAVLSAPPNQPATVNLMAPIIVNAVTRIGAQVMLEGTRFSTREIFMLPAASPVIVDAREPGACDAQTTSAATTAAE